MLNNNKPGIYELPAKELILNCPHCGWKNIGYVPEADVIFICEKCCDLFSSTIYGKTKIHIIKKNEKK